MKTELNSIVIHLPDRFKDKGFNNYLPHNVREKDIKMQLIKYSRDQKEKRSLVLMGNIGTGKTHLAVSVLKNLPELERKFVTSRSEWGIKHAIIPDGQKTLFLIADEFFQVLNDHAIAKKSKMGCIMDYLKAYDMILLDDLRVDHLTEAKAENLYLLLNRAYLDLRKMIITTNINMDQLEKREPRIASRLSEMSLIIKFNGEDYRKKAQTGSVRA